MVVPNQEGELLLNLEGRGWAQGMYILGADKPIKRPTSLPPKMLPVQLMGNEDAEAIRKVRHINGSCHPTGRNAQGRKRSCVDVLT